MHPGAVKGSAGSPQVMAPDGVLMVIPPVVANWLDREMKNPALGGVLQSIGTGERTRTSTTSLPVDFESTASTIPPHRHV